MWFFPQAAFFSAEYETKHVRKIVNGLKQKPVVMECRKPKPWVKLNNQPVWLGRRK